ncbi:hypothetical protein ACO1O0_002333 [Amphichorda felina]
MSGIANKVKDTLQGDKTSHTGDAYNTQTSGTTTTNPRFAAEPSVPRTTAAGSAPAYNSTTGTGAVPPTGDHYSHGAATNTTAFDSTGPALRTDGPHKSDMMNKADPRVDSDRDYSKNMGLNPHGNADTARNTSSGAYHGAPVGTTTGTTGQPLQGTTHTTAPTSSTTYGQSTTIPSSTTTAPHGTNTTGGLTGSHNTTGTSGVSEGAFGPHSTRAANAADPRIDSDLDNSRNMGAARTGDHTTGTSGYGSTTAPSGYGSTTAPSGYGSTTTGTTTGHPTSTTGHTTGHTTGTTGHTAGHTTGTTGHTTGHSTGPDSVTTGPAPHTAGPHKSDMANKLDPRVDSNLDGSKTVGGNKTFAGSNKTNY